MSFFGRWFTKPTSIPTVHNGFMKLTKLFGRWEIHSEHDTYQSGAYMDGLWSKVLKTFPKSDAPMRVLLLGVAMGNTFNLLLRHWPNARIVGVDWEPDLLALGRQLGIMQENPRITFISGDAVKVTPHIRRTV